MLASSSVLPSPSAAAGMGTIAGIEALRGVLAISVSLFHLNWCLPNAYLAVDVFFVVSGLVIGRKYEGQLRSGAGGGRNFLLGRLIRLYPLYFASVMVGVGAAWAQSVVVAGQFNLFGLAWRAVLLVPSFGAGLSPIDDELFPMNPAVWSLWFEIVASMLFAVMCWCPRWMMAAPVLAGFLLLLHGAITRDTLSLGTDAESFVYGAARIGFSFFIGVLLSDHAMHVRRGRRAAVAITACLAGVLVLFSKWAGAPFGNWTALFIMTSVSPVVALVLFSLDLQGWARRAAITGGTMSYAIYILHVPLQRLAVALSTKWGWDGTTLSTAVGATALTTVTVAVAWILTYRVDVPVRQWLLVLVGRGHRSPTHGLTERLI